MMDSGALTESVLEERPRDLGEVAQQLRDISADFTYAAEEQDNIPLKRGLRAKAAWWERCAGTYLLLPSFPGEVRGGGLVAQTTHDREVDSRSASYAFP